MTVKIWQLVSHIASVVRKHTWMNTNTKVSCIFLFSTERKHNYQLLYSPLNLSIIYLSIYVSIHLSIHLLYVFVPCLCICLCTNVCSAYRSEKESLGSLELELQTGLSH